MKLRKGSRVKIIEGVRTGETGKIVEVKDCLLSGRFLYKLYLDLGKYFWISELEVIPEKSSSKELAKARRGELGKSKVKVELSFIPGNQYWIAITPVDLPSVLLRCVTECYSRGAARKKARQIIKALNLEEVK